jgi:hypothetical protein
MEFLKKLFITIPRRVIFRGKKLRKIGSRTSMEHELVE